MIERVIPTVVVVVAISRTAAAGPSPAPLDWPTPVRENRPGCYWWWPGSAVDETNLTWNLETLRAAGMGGVTIVPIYGVKGWEDRFLPYLSEDWLRMLDHTVREADRLGMWVDMTTGTGWPFGGPTVTEADADALVQWKNGRLSWRFSGMQVKRAAPGGAGRVLNPYSPPAMERYLAHFDQAFSALDLRLPRAMYHDSFEYRGNWTAQLPAEFLRRRGYDLREHLPALFGQGDSEVESRIRADYRTTLAELHLEYLETWVRWAARHGCTTRNQAHGAPGNLLDLYAAAGIPETETFGSTRFAIPGVRRSPDNVDDRNHPRPLINRMASSAAHLAGRPLVAAEACTWIRNHFRTALSQVKPELDQLFLNGINHLFFHGCCYSPRTAPWPGWLFYASLEYNPRNAIWRDAPFLNAYITRCQSILQAGEPDNDVALYWPVQDLWHAQSGLAQKLTVHAPAWLTNSPCGELAAWLKDHGYGFDYVSDRQLQAGRAGRYGAILVPPTQHLPLATLRVLLAAADGGQPVLFVDALPADVPGWFQFEERRAALHARLKGREHLVALRNGLAERLAATSVAREPMVEAGLAFIRRRHAEGRHYFVANLGARAVDDWIPLGVPFRSAVIMDPQTGRTGVARRRGDRAIRLQLQPGESRILRTFDTRQVTGPSAPLFRAAGAKPEIVRGEWSVEFLAGGPVRPAPFRTAALKSWTELGDREARRFAGTARYEIEFEAPETPADEWWLDLGDVRESARVYLNDRRVAVLYSVPFRTLVGTFLKPGRNRLAVEITNLSANRIRDLDRRGVPWKRFHDINLVDHNYRPFDASNWPLTPSGLLGPVRLIPLKRIAP